MNNKQIFKLIRLTKKNCLHHQISILTFLSFWINLVNFYNFPAIELFRCSAQSYDSTLCVGKYFCYINLSVKKFKRKSLSVCFQLLCDFLKFSKLILFRYFNFPDVCMSLKHFFWNKRVEEKYNGFVAISTGTVYSILIQQINESKKRANPTV